jgi:hypothetical protein
VAVRREYRAIEPVFRFHDDVIADAKPSRSVAWRPPTRPPTDLAAAHRSERAELATARKRPTCSGERLCNRPIPVIHCNAAPLRVAPSIDRCAA